MVEYDPELFHLVDFSKSEFERIRGDVYRAREVGSEAEIAFAYGSALEASSWLCLGVDLEYFPRSHALRVFQYYSDILRYEKSDSRDVRWVVELNEWTELVAAGHFEEALEVQVTRGLPIDRQELQSLFQAAQLLTSSAAADPKLRRFQTGLLFGESWLAELEEELHWVDSRFVGPATEASADRSPAEVLSHVVSGCENWIVDGVVGSLSYLESFMDWADYAESALIESGLPALVSGVGRTVHWRLDRTKGQVSNRLADAVRLTEKAVSLYSEFTKMEMSGWPQSLNRRLDALLDQWDVLAAPIAVGVVEV